MLANDEGKHLIVQALKGSQLLFMEMELKLDHFAM